MVAADVFELAGERRGVRRCRGRLAAGNALSPRLAVRGGHPRLLVDAARADLGQVAGSAGRRQPQLSSLAGHGAGAARRPGRRWSGVDRRRRRRPRRRAVCRGRYPPGSIAATLPEGPRRGTVAALLDPRRAARPRGPRAAGAGGPRGGGAGAGRDPRPAAAGGTASTALGRRPRRRASWSPRRPRSPPTGWRRRPVWWSRRSPTGRRVAAGRALEIEASVWSAGEIVALVPEIERRSSNRAGRWSGCRGERGLAAETSRSQRRRFRVTVPPTDEPTVPYYLRRPRQGDLYDWQGVPVATAGRAAWPAAGAGSLCAGDRRPAGDADARGGLPLRRPGVRRAPPAGAGGAAGGGDAGTGPGPSAAHGERCRRHRAGGHCAIQPGRAGGGHGCGCTGGGSAAVRGGAGVLAGRRGGQQDRAIPGQAARFDGSLPGSRRRRAGGRPALGGSGPADGVVSPHPTAGGAGRRR